MSPSTFGNGLPHPLRVPPSWFCTTSTVCSSSTLRACCIPLPILGFTAFPAVAKQPSPRCFPALRSLPPRWQLRRVDSSGVAPVLLVAPRGRVTASTLASRCVHRVPCPPDLPLLVCSAPVARRVVLEEPGLQGLAPPSGPVPAPPFAQWRGPVAPMGVGRPPRARPLGCSPLARRAPGVGVPSSLHSAFAARSAVRRAPEETSWYVKDH